MMQYDATPHNLPGDITMYEKYFFPQYVTLDA